MFVSTLCPRLLGNLGQVTRLLWASVCPSLNRASTCCEHVINRMVASRTAAWGEHFVSVSPATALRSPDKANPSVGRMRPRDWLMAGAGRAEGVSPALLLCHWEPSSSQQMLVHGNDTLHDTHKIGT